MLPRYLGRLSLRTNGDKDVSRELQDKTCCFGMARSEILLYVMMEPDDLLWGADSSALPRQNGEKEKDRPLPNKLCAWLRPFGCLSTHVCCKP